MTPATLPLYVAVALVVACIVAWPVQYVADRIKAHRARCAEWPPLDAAAVTRIEAQRVADAEAWASNSHRLVTS